MIPRLSDELVVAALALLVTLSLGCGATPSAADFARRPLVHAATLSPGGSQLVYLTTDEKGHSGIGGVNLASMTPFAVTLGTDDIYDYTWVTEERIAFNVAMRRIYSRGLYLYDLGDKVAKGINEEDLTSIVSVVEDDRSRMYLWYLAGPSHRRQGLAVVDLDRRPVSGMGHGAEEFMVLRWLPTPAGELHGWIADRTGRVRISATFERDKLRAWIHGGDDDPWKELPVDLETSRIAGFTEDGQGLYVVHDDGTAPTESLRIFDLATQTLGPAVFGDPDFALDGARVLFSRKESAAVGITYARDALTTHWFSERFRALQAAVDAKLPGRLNQLVDWDREERHLVIAASSDRHPTRFFLYDVGTGKVSALPEARPWIDPAQMRPMQTIRYRTRDGLQLQGYLTLPEKDAKGTKPALVVHPHGGPWLRDVWEWNPEVQFLASRGYAVFQPNYRGSTGFKREVTGKRSDFAAMLNDVVDGTEAVCRAGIVDPDRVAIYGGSFGGYLALAGAAFAPDRFKCAISFAGVFDWAKLVEQDRYRRDARAVRHYKRRYIGDPKADAERFDAMSPLKHAANIRIPVLLAHGTSDSVVEDEQTKTLGRVLKERRVPFEAMYFKDEGHGLSDPGNAAKFLSRLEQFLAKNL